MPCAHTQALYVAVDLPPRAGAATAIAVEPGLQVIELIGGMPVMRWRNQIYACSWADTVGTDLFFTRTDELVAVSRVRLQGQRGVLAPAIAPADRYPQQQQQQQQTRSQPQHNQQRYEQQQHTSLLPPPSDRRQHGQARFIERLARLKQARGEPDVVRTAFPQRRPPGPSVAARRHGWRAAGVGAGGSGGAGGGRDGNGNGNGNNDDFDHDHDASNNNYRPDLTALAAKAQNGDTDAAAALEEICVRDGLRQGGGM